MLADFKFGIFSLLLSVITDAEIQDAPKEVKSIYLEFRRHCDEFIKITPEAIELADMYIKRGFLSKNYHNDALHISAATIAGADLLVSWNFKHIVHFEKIQGFNSVNMEMGYKPILIYSPMEVTRYGGKGN
ncbi:MAG: PIN domain protein [Nitrospirae bacterium]|nr:PIN domain protein [Nitrospirota bacterium]MBF0592512.1 PIN domain protein [Nitrospirota bacterium]